MGKLISLLSLIGLMAMPPSIARASEGRLNYLGSDQLGVHQAGMFLALDEPKEKTAEKDQKKKAAGDQPLKRRGGPGALPPSQSGSRTLDIRPDLVPQNK
jgi:hypothetical protein